MKDACLSPQKPAVILNRCASYWNVYFEMWFYTFRKWILFSTVETRSSEEFVPTKLHRVELQKTAIFSHREPVLVSAQQGTERSWVFVTGNQSQILRPVLRCCQRRGSDVFIPFWNLLGWQPEPRFTCDCVLDLGLPDFFLLHLRFRLIPFMKRKLGYC